MLGIADPLRTERTQLLPQLEALPTAPSRPKAAKMRC